MKNILEKDIEVAVKEYARSRGCLAYKFVSPGHAFVPDCLIIAPDGQVMFIEFKRLGGKATAGQLREMARIKTRNVVAVVVNDIQSGKQWVDVMVGS